MVIDLFVVDDDELKSKEHYFGRYHCDIEVGDTCNLNDIGCLNDPVGGASHCTSFE